MKEILFDNNVAEFIYEPENSLLSLRWKKYANSIEYRDIFTKSLGFIIQFKITKFLADICLEGTVNPDDRKWLETEIIPKTIEAGLKFNAIILNKDIFKKYYLSHIKDSSTKTGILEIKHFEDYEQGYKWIISQNN